MKIKLERTLKENQLFKGEKVNKLGLFNIFQHVEMMGWKMTFQEWLDKQIAAGTITEA
jgi:GTP cyclohydrolase I